MIVGLGQTGLSLARHLAERGKPFCVADDYPEPEALAQLQAISPLTPVISIDQIDPAATQQLLLSPGVPLSLPGIQDCLSKGIEVTGDVALFSSQVKAPVVAVTGSNGKSTVTSMLGAFASAQLPRVAVAGNIGIACLDVLADEVDYYILELSSYQLDLVTAMPLEVAGLLNLSPDHLDRYSSAEAYFQAKLSIFDNARTAVISEQLLDQGYTPNCDRVVVFGDSPPGDSGHYGLTHSGQASWLMKGADVLMDCAELQVLGRHNQLNALAALAMGDAMGLDLALMVETLRNFKGLPHRCELICEKDGVKWINDSKATNVAATLSAVDALPSQGGLILILGGEAKGADFSALQSALSGKVKKVLLLGEARDIIAKSLDEKIEWEKQTGYETAVARAIELADAGDIVMLSPACSSLDMFSSYIERGAFFTQLVREALL